jgi:CheY-like chemotaxis protein
MRDLLQNTMGGSIHIETRLHPGLWPALVDPTQLELAILNLAINARDAMNVGGALEVSTRNATLGSPTTAEEPPAGEYVSVRVTGNGSGMSDEIRAKVFEPFFTTKEVGKGSGLGLSQVLGFAKQSGGGVSIESRPGSGTSVDIYLPRAHAERVNHVIEPALSEIATAGGSTILLIDDDNAVREVTRTMLHELGYLVLEAGSGGAALELLDREGQIDLIIADFAMPGMNGADVARQALARRPRLPVLFVTGFADRSALGGISETQIVSKPFVNDELARKVRLALAAGVSAKVARP